jgi:hypothetical protein
MKRHNIWLAAACVTCATLVWSYAFGLEGTEFSGGRTTGPLLYLSDLGLILFAAALVLTLFYLRVAALMAVVASFAFACRSTYISLLLDRSGTFSQVTTPPQRKLISFGIIV